MNDAAELRWIYYLVLEIHIHFIRDMVLSQTLNVHYVPTVSQLAGILTYPGLVFSFEFQVAHFSGCFTCCMHRCCHMCKLPNVHYVNLVSKVVKLESFSSCTL